MQYLSEIQALNIPCSLDTTGDWHGDAINWKNLCLKESSTSVFQDYGIEKRKVPYLDNKVFFVANHIRACLDLIEDAKFDSVQGMKNDFICSEKYNAEIFKKVLLLKNKKNWANINRFMENEYLLKWVRFVKQYG